VNLKIRQLSSETSHDFIEWCGLVDGSSHKHIQVGLKIHQQDKYYDFISDYPDYAPKSRMQISRMKFSKWMVAYAVYTTGQQPEEGRDAAGKWMIIRKIVPTNEKTTQSQMFDKDGK
jgi:hypothetical protein